jgi:hypothetical protein
MSVKSGERSNRSGQPWVLADEETAPCVETTILFVQDTAPCVETMLRFAQDTTPFGETTFLLA